MQLARHPRIAVTPAAKYHDRMAHRHHERREISASRSSAARRLTFSGELLSAFTLPNLADDLSYGEILSVYGERALNRLEPDLHGS